MGLLIGNNSNKAMKPWRVINSQDIGSHAVKNPNLDWVFSDPLTEPKDSYSKTDGQQRVNVNRITLQEELTRQKHNHDFSEQPF